MKKEDESKAFWLKYVWGGLENADLIDHTPSTFRPPPEGQGGHSEAVCPDPFCLAMLLVSWLLFQEVPRGPVCQGIGGCRGNKSKGAGRPLSPPELVIPSQHFHGRNFLAEGRTGLSLVPSLESRS